MASPRGTRGRSPVATVAFAVVLAALLAVVGASVWAGVRVTPIGRITEDPGRFEGKAVTVAGTASSGFSLLGQGAYQLEDDTGAIWIRQHGPVPQQGARVRARGTVDTLFQVGSAAVVSIRVHE